VVLGHSYRLADSTLLPRARRLPHSCHSSGLETHVSFAPMAVQRKRMVSKSRRRGDSRDMSCCTIAVIDRPPV